MPNPLRPEPTIRQELATVQGLIFLAVKMCAGQVDPKLLLHEQAALIQELSDAT